MDVWGGNLLDVWGGNLPKQELPAVTNGFYGQPVGARFVLACTLRRIEELIDKINNLQLKKAEHIKAIMILVACKALIFAAVMPAQKPQYNESELAPHPSPGMPRP